jgi:hypothetical protein
MGIEDVLPRIELCATWPVSLFVYSCSWLEQGTVNKQTKNKPTTVLAMRRQTHRAMGRRLMRMTSVVRYRLVCAEVPVIQAQLGTPAILTAQ